MTTLTVILVAVLGVPAPQQAPGHQSARPGLIASDGASVEAGLQHTISTVPGNVSAYLELAALQQGRGAPREAEATLMRARQAHPLNPQVVVALEALYHERGDFEHMIAMMQVGADLDPANPQAQVLVAANYWEKLSKDNSLAPAQQYTYAVAGLAAADRALAIHSDSPDALTYKGLLLRQRALHETGAIQLQTVDEAAGITARAVELRKGRTPATGARDRATHVPVDALPLPRGTSPLVPGPAPPLRYGATTKGPAKIKDVRPVYPPDAKSAGISGVVILELTIGTDGRVHFAKVLRSIPALDQAAIDAAMQWEFTPREVSGQLVPAVLTVTVNFTRDKVGRKQGR